MQTTNCRQACGYAAWCLARLDKSSNDVLVGYRKLIDTYHESFYFEKTAPLMLENAADAGERLQLAEGFYFDELGNAVDHATLWRMAKMAESAASSMTPRQYAARLLALAAKASAARSESDLGYYCFDNLERFLAAPLIGRRRCCGKSAMRCAIFLPMQIGRTARPQARLAKRNPPIQPMHSKSAVDYAPLIHPTHLSIRRAATAQYFCAMIAPLIKKLPCPLLQRDQSFGTNAINSPSAITRSIDKPGSLKQFEMLDNGGTRNRQAPSQFAGRHRYTRKPLKHDHANRVTEQGEQSQYRPKSRSVCVRLGHAKVSGQTDTFGKRVAS